MHVGVDYYPEHWPRATWEPNLDLMKQAGFNVVRLAEFAWANLEPEEGRFEFAWLDEILSLLQKRGIKAILGTPTATMPAWVPRKYPECLAMKPNGQRIVWGVRKNNCFTSGTYRLLSERVTRAMAERYADHPNVIGWQTDNEFGNNPCSCPTCRADFQDWLRAKHKTLDACNAHLGTHFWSEKIGEWCEIPIPDEAGQQNPSLLLEWQRYGSWLNVRFQRDQVRILRERCPRQFITHNFMGYHSDLDYYELAADLDFVSWDNYPVWGKPEFPYDASGAHGVMRGLKRKNFWIMEQTAGPGGWGEFGRNARPGELRKVALHAVAHGADGLVWFRWRTCTVGREQYWHGLLGHDGKPGRRYREAARTASEFTKLWPSLEGTTVRSEVAMIYDYESIWATRFQKSFAENNWHWHLRQWQIPLLRAGVNLDMVRPGQDLSGYRVVIAPQLHILPDAVARQLSAFVERGGVLVTGIRTGVKDEHNRCHERTLPGLLSEALGIRIDEYESVAPAAPYAAKGSAAIPGTFTVDAYADWVVPTGAEALVGYTTWHMTDYAVATRNRFGRGWGYYLGANVKEDAIYTALVADALAKAGVEGPLEPPPMVEVTTREGAGKRLLFLVNHGEEERSVAIPAGASVLLGKASGQRVTLGAYDVAVLSLGARESAKPGRGMGGGASAKRARRPAARRGAARRRGR